MQVVLRDGVETNWLSGGRAFTVLAVEGSELRLWADREHTCALFPISDFRIVDARLSRFWLADSRRADFGEIVLRPIEWQRSGFWEEY
jgi:hypothetical protein